MSSKLSLRAPALCFVAVMALGLVEMTQSFTRLSGADLPQGWDALRTGRLTTTLEKQLDQHLPQRDVLIAVANDLRYLLLRGSPDAVRVGRDGWLFLTEELQVDPDGAASLAARADIVRTVARHLQSQGIALVVALVPDKARIHADRLAEGRLPAALEGRYDAVLQALRERQVQAVDLAGPMRAARQQAELYYQGDTHWNQHGARTAAQAVAAATRGVALDPVTRFETVTTGPVAARTGDLVRMMGLAELPVWLRPGDDLEAPLETRALATPPAATGGAGLFGETRVPVTLLGTSYSQRANFHGALQEALSAQVLNMAQDGGGFAQAAHRYFDDDAFRTAPPRLIVWEIPERFFTQPVAQDGAWLKALGW